MKILHLDTGGGWRGGQQQVLWLMEGLRQRGHEQLLVAPEASPLVGIVSQRGLPVSAMASAGRSLANIKTLRSSAQNFDILHAHDAHAHSLAWLAHASRGARRWPCLVVSRRVAFPVGRFGTLKYRAAGAYITVSDYVRRQLLKAGVPAAKLNVVYDGVNVPSPPDLESRGEFRRRFGLEDRTPVVGTFTSLAPEKLLRDEVDLLEALPPSVHLWIGRPAAEAGQRDAEIALLEHATQRGVGDRLRILSLSDDLEKFLASLDVFVYLSRSEGLGSAILLAMAYGLPVVANRVGGIPEIVHHKETGLLVGSVAGAPLQDELLAAVSLLLDDPRLRAELGSQGRKFVMQNATVDLMVQKTEAVYAELLRARVRKHSARHAGILEGTA